MHESCHWKPLQLLSHDVLRKDTRSSNCGARISESLRHPDASCVNGLQGRPVPCFASDASDSRCVGVHLEQTTNQVRARTKTALSEIKSVCKLFSDVPSTTPMEN